jgi:hypothetical protein
MPITMFFKELLLTGLMDNTLPPVRSSIVCTNRHMKELLEIIKKK